MPIRTQFDTGVYGGFRKNETSLGEVLGAVQGVTGLIQNAKMQKREEQLTEDDQFLNDVYAKNFAGWDGRDPAEFQRRKQAVEMEVQKTKPTLFGKSLGVSKTLEDAMTGRLTADADLDGTILDNEKKQLDVYSSQLAFNRDFLKDLEYQQGIVGNQFALVAEGKQSYADAVHKIKALGVNAKLPTEEEFNQNPGQFYDYLVAQEMKNKEAMNALEQREKELGIQKTEKELSWFDRLKQAEINSKNKPAPGSDKPVSQTIALQMSATEQGINMLDNLVENPSFKSLTNSPIDKLRALNPWDEDAKSFQQLIATTKQVIGKGLEGGVLRKEDEEKYKKILPDRGEPLNIRQRKAQQLRDMLENKYNTDISSLASTGANVSNFEPAPHKEYSGDGTASGGGSADEFEDLWKTYGGK